MIRLHVIATAGCLALAACATPHAQPPAPTKDSGAAAPAAAPAASANPVEAVPLKVVLTDQGTTGGTMQLRGEIVNPHAEPVEGVRMQLVFVAPNEKGGWKVLEIQQTEFSASIPPGGSTMLSWDVESRYLGPETGQFVVAAYPKRLGDKEMPPPDHWNE